MVPAPPFDPWSLREAAEGLLLVAAALETGLLELLERERTVEELARERGLDPRALEICLRGLEELGVVERGSRGVRLTTFGRSRFVDRASPRYVAADLPLWRDSLRGWLFLDEVLRSGRPLQGTSGDAPELQERLSRSLAAKPPERVERLVERVLARAAVREPRVLDLGGGTGVHARAFLARGCRVTLLELPAVLRHARDALGLARFRDLELVEGDLRDELPRGPFDVLLLADVLHELPPAEARSVLARAARVGAPSAVVAVADRFRGVTHGAALFAVSLLLYTEGGDAYEVGEVTGWLAEAGFSDPRVEALDSRLTLLTARLPDAGPRRSG